MMKAVVPDSLSNGSVEGSDGKGSSGIVVASASVRGGSMAARGGVEQNVSISWFLALIEKKLTTHYMNHC